MDESITNNLHRVREYSHLLLEQFILAEVEFCEQFFERTFLRGSNFMTLILTQINRYGIIHASDSALTSGDSPAGEGKKLFIIDYLNAALTYTGSFNVNWVCMEDWMNNFIQNHRTTKGISLASFAKKLRSELEIQMTSFEKRNGACVHLAGYVKRNRSYHPEFWHITNIPGVDLKTGENIQPKAQFDEEREELWRDDSLMEKIQIGGYVYFINGFPAGRISYNLLQFEMREFLNKIWNNPDFKFRPPKSLNEFEFLIRMNFQTIVTLFKISDYPAPYIGGEVKTHIIMNPGKN